jgi:hypothetical protein
MTDPRRYLIRMIVFVIAVACVVAVLSPTLHASFVANPGLNTLIIGVLLLSIVHIFREVWLLTRDVRWIEGQRVGRTAPSLEEPPRLLAPLAAMLGERGGRISLSATSLRSVLDGIAARLDESRDIARYAIGLLIFLGLLGTFWGLMKTVGSISEVISSLTSTAKDFGSMFNDLKAGLRAPLSGMGLAFSSSLFGLSGSLVLGFLELQAGQAQNRFFNDLEEWLAGQTRLTGGTLAIEGDQAVPAYVQALLEQTADSLESLTRTLVRGEENRATSHATMVSLAEHVQTLVAQMRTEQTLMVKIAEAQLEMRPILARLADQTAKGGLGQSDAAVEEIRNLDRHVVRLIEELGAGRTDLIAELRSEIRVLSRTMAAIAEKAPQR